MKTTFITVGRSHRGNNTPRDSKSQTGLCLQVDRFGGVSCSFSQSKNDSVFRSAWLDFRCAFLQRATSSLLKVTSQFVEHQELLSPTL